MRFKKKLSSHSSKHADCCRHWSLTTGAKSFKEYKTYKDYIDLVCNIEFSKLVAKIRILQNAPAAVRHTTATKTSHCRDKLYKKYFSTYGNFTLRNVV